MDKQAGDAFVFISIPDGDSKKIGHRNHFYLG
jgi:hypothetical protein